MRSEMSELTKGLAKALHERAQSEQTRQNSASVLNVVLRNILLLGLMKLESFGTLK